MERTLTARDGTALVIESRELPSPRARIVVVHGYAEHRGRYVALASQLFDAGFACHLFDLRGHGESGGAPAHVERFDDYVDDLALVVDRVRAESAPVPLFLVGHSLGGLIALMYVLRRDGIDGVAVSSPFLQPAFEVSAAKKILAAVASRVVPSMALASPLAPESLSRDQRVVDAYESDPLVHRTTTPRWFVEVQQAQRELGERAPSIRLPLLMLLGEEDAIADHRLASDVFDRIGSADKTLHAYPGLRHEVFNELEREKVIADLLAWLQARS